MDLWMHEVLRQRRAEGELALILSFKNPPSCFRQILKPAGLKNANSFHVL